MTVALELDRATKSFGSVHALVDGSILLRAGEVHALLGENGAGKSTLVKILAGVYQPDGGELRIDGEPTRAAPGRRRARRRDLGHLPGADAVPRPDASPRTSSWAPAAAAGAAASTAAR